MKNFLTVCMAVATGVVVGGVILYGISTMSPLTFSTGHSGSIRQLDYPAFVSIMLTAVSVILAGLGFVIALLAFIGWNSIGDRVSSLATTFLRDAMKEGGQLHSLVKDEAKAIIYRGVEPVDTEYDEDDGTQEENPR